MFSPYGTVEWRCLQENGQYDYSSIDCDLRAELEAYGYTQTVAIIVLVFQAIGLVINALIYVGLRQWYVPCFCLQISHLMTAYIHIQPTMLNLAVRGYIVDQFDIAMCQLCID